MSFSNHHDLFSNSSSSSSSSTFSSPSRLLQVCRTNRAVSRSWTSTQPEWGRPKCWLLTSTLRSWPSRPRTTAGRSWRDWCERRSPLPWTVTSRSAPLHHLPVKLKCDHFLFLSQFRLSLLDSDCSFGYVIVSTLFYF